MIELNYRDARPIYLQVKEGLRHLVVTGAIREGEQFPSVRALAAALVPIAMSYLWYRKKSAGAP